MENQKIGADTLVKTFWLSSNMAEKQKEEQPCTKGQPSMLGGFTFKQVAFQCILSRIYHGVIHDLVTFNWDPLLEGSTSTPSYS